MARSRASARTVWLLIVPTVTPSVSATRRRRHQETCPIVSPLGTSIAWKER